MLAQPVVVDRIGGDAGDVLQRRARVPRLGDAQLGGLAAELAHGQHGGDVGPRHLLPAGLDQGVQELMQAQASPEGQPEEHGPELAHAADLDAAEVGQFPGTGLGRGLRGPVGKFRLTRPGLAAIQERLDLVPAGAEVVVVELAQRRDDPLPRAALGADGLAERPVLVGLTIDASAVLAEEHALVFRAGRRVPRGCSPLHEPFDLRRPPFPGIPKNPPQRIRGRFRPAAELGLTPKTLLVSGLRRRTSGRLPKMRRRVSCCIRPRIASTSRQPSIASRIASYCSRDSATDTVLPFSFRVHW